MSRGRPRKPSAVRELEGGRSHSSPIPPDMPLHGLPVLPDALAGEHAREHFRFVAAEFGAAGVLKRADAPGLRALAMAWDLMVRAYDAADVSAFAKAHAAWHKSASALGISVVDRAKLMALVGGKKQESPLRAKYQVVS